MSTILKQFRRKFSSPLYVQIWESRLRVSVIGASDVFDEKPLVAIETSSKGKKTIKEIGNRAESIRGGNISIINPFSHPRTILADFQVAEKLLQHAFAQLHKNSFIRASPDVIVHPMEKIEGGLTQIEKRALRELVFGSGAFEAYLHIGTPLAISGWEFSDLVNSLEKLI